MQDEIGRFYPLNRAKPRPVRTMEHRWGLPEMDEGEKAIVREDDVLMFRFILVYLLADITAKARKNEGGGVKFFMEQPAEPKGEPRCASWWRTPEWKTLEKLHDLKEVTFMQGDWGGRAVKPTTVGTTMDFQGPEKGVCGLHLGEALRHDREVEKPRWEMTDEEKLSSSKALARWAPGMMRELARCLRKEVDGQSKVKVKSLSWEEHVKLGHLPFRRDCRVCQEASARDRPQRRVRHPAGNVLSVDLSGPFIMGTDVDGVQDKRYLLVAAYTWPQIDTSEGEELPGDEGGEEEGGGLEEGLLPEEDPGEEAAEEGFEVGGAAEEQEQPILPEPQKEPHPLKTLYMTIPLRSKDRKEVLAAIQEVYIRLRREGFLVLRLHSDKGGEFMSKELASWCRLRDIRKSTRTPDQMQENGRAEAAVGVVKSMMRRVLIATKWDPVWWPCIARYVSEVRFGYDLKGHKPKYQFGEDVVVPKRAWKQKSFEAKNQRGKYLAPLYDITHGHAVLLNADQKVVAVSKVLSGLREGDGPDAPGADGDEEEENREGDALFDEALRVRRIMRVKTSDPARMDDGGGDKVAERIRLLRHIIVEEEERMLEDEKETAEMTFRMVRKLREEEENLKQTVPDQTEAEKILHTKMVSPNEVISDKERWAASIKTELDSLMTEKQALRRVPPREAEKLIKEKGSKLSVVPAKAIFSVKAGSSRRKTRLVVCGNHVERDTEAEGDTFAGGTDITAIRLQVKVAMERKWTMSALDIKSAFLNADLHEEREPENLVAMRPPTIMVRLGYAEPGELWLIDKAMYGLRQSPRRWSDHRDAELAKLTWEVNGAYYKLEQCAAEQNLWRILEVRDGTEALAGLVSIYVDDVLTATEESVRERFEAVISERWETSKPDVLTEDCQIRFLGMNLMKKEGGIFLHQSDYVEELLKRHKDELVRSKTPMSKELADEADQDPGNFTAMDLTKAQKVTGEILWLMTRTRPDLLYSMSRMCSMTSKNPKWTIKAAGYVLGYLKETKDWGLWVSGDAGRHWSGHGAAGLQAYADASFAPLGERSQGCSLVAWNGTVIAWKAGKQAFPALSTAESELIEAIDSVILGDSVEALITDTLGMDNFKKMLLSDNAAAVAIATDVTGSWRTRHLRLRSFHLRWRIRAGDWEIRHCPGQQMFADLGTKPLGPARIKELCGLWDLKAMREESEAVRLNKTVVQGSKEKWIKLLVILIMVAGCRAQGEGQQQEEERMDLSVVVLLIAVVAIVVYRLMSEVASAFCGRIRQLRVLSVEQGTQTDDDEEVIDVPRASSTSVARSSSSTSGDPSTARTLRRRRGGGERQPEGQVGEEPAAARPAEPDEVDERLNARWREELMVMEQLRWRELQPEPEATEIYHLTAMGDKVHWRRNCFGLRNATARGLRAVLPCPNCWLGEGQRRRGARSWRGQDGFLHANHRCPGIGREPQVPLTPCRFCQGHVTMENYEQVQNEGMWPRGLA